MEINGRYYDLKFTGYTLLIYKEEFGKDLFSSLKDMEEDYTIFFQLLYALVKSANENVDSYEGFMRGIEDITEVMSKENVQKIMKVILKDKQPTKEVKKN